MITAKSIKERRNRLGWTQKTLAERAGVPLTALSRIENAIYFQNDYVKSIDETLRSALRSLEKPMLEDAKFCEEWGQIFTIDIWIDSFVKNRNLTPCIPLNEISENFQRHASFCGKRCPAPML